ncbi:DUF2064 domain-containing protein [Tsukamurella sp. 8F]|uniref:TIGR04282 family arsenosugar biosynthesis glycosyltransferase n=1 Tax=unclassified Tsukamurella TaxID=2633480 RepID=UPI0023B9CD82|nr:MULTISPECIES: DUF2064 domain-containing protein [unclassified Tsukamurella]MDF0529847.1 DUF2064 domain-containing protein [Tsukamurella sp. 8J]MDF0587039.1 DUF2064 domain-containing protein [Tsukamurella sp. 8F]
MNTILVVAKRPVPGHAKTRLIPGYGAGGAARLAAAALRDTLRAALAVPDTRCTVAFHEYDWGPTAPAECDDLLRRCDVFLQTGTTFAERLADAHRRAGPGPVLQIGMDTPQVTPELLAHGLDQLGAGTAVLGPALDGGWWALGLHGGRGAEALLHVRMSTPLTGADTRRALRSAGLSVTMLAPLRDVDRPSDVSVVAAACPPGSEFATTARRLAVARL